MSGKIVTEAKFNELVDSTTRYLQDLVNRVAALEAKLAEKEKRGGKKDAE